MARRYEHSSSKKKSLIRDKGILKNVCLSTEVKQLGGGGGKVERREEGRNGGEGRKREGGGRGG